jgi:hypothetical protein
MKSRIGLFVLAGAVMVGPTLAQTSGNSSGDDLSGRGTAKHLTKFTGTHTVGNSGVVESGGNIGIGTTAPVYPVHVFSTNTVPPPNGQCCVAVTSFVENAASSDSNTVIAFEGLARPELGPSKGSTARHQALRELAFLASTKQEQVAVAAEYSE